MCKITDKKEKKISGKILGIYLLLFLNCAFFNTTQAINIASCSFAGGEASPDSKVTPEAVLEWEAKDTVPDSVYVLRATEEIAVSFYPNPAHEYIVIRSSVPAKMIISDSGGEVSLSREFAAGIRSFDIRRLPPGLYLIEFHAKDGVKIDSGKFIKQ